MKNCSMKAFIAIGCLTLCEFAFAGVGVRVYATNYTGEDLPSVGVCNSLNPSVVCGSFFTVKEGDNVQIDYSEMDLGKPFDKTYTIMDNMGNPFCAINISGDTTGYSFYPITILGQQHVVPVPSNTGVGICDISAQLVTQINENGLTILDDTIVINANVYINPASPLAPADTQPFFPITQPSLKEVASAKVRIGSGYRYYDVTCTNGKATTFSESGLGWVNEQHEIVGYITEKYELFNKLAVPYCRSLISYGRSSQLDTVNNTYTVTCVNGNSARFMYDVIHEYYSNGDQSYHVKKEYKDNQGYLNRSIAERFCQGSLKLNEKRQVQAISASTQPDAFVNADISRTYTVTCKAPSAFPVATFKRKNASHTEWVSEANSGKTYILKPPQAALFNNEKTTDTERYYIFEDSIAEPYCDGM